MIVHMKKKEATKQISVRFPEDLYQRIDKEAQEEDRSFNAQVIRLLREYSHLRDKQQQKNKKSEEK